MPGVIHGRISTKTLGFLLILLSIAIFFAAWQLSPGVNFVVVMALLCLFSGLIGRHTNGMYFGILISDRNLMSISRFQTMIWTIVVLSAYIVIAIARAKAGIENPLDIEIDYRLWIMMGISTTSLVATPLLLANKEQNNVISYERKQAVAEKTATSCGSKDISANDIVANATGILYANRTPAEADFTDMFEGDEIANTCSIDIAKLQMFFFTLVAAVTYCITIFLLIRQTPVNSLDKLPALSEGFLAIMGISYSGYVSSKTITYTK